MPLHDRDPCFSRRTHRWKTCGPGIWAFPVCAAGQMKDSQIDEAGAEGAKAIQAEASEGALIRLLLCNWRTLCRRPLSIDIRVVNLTWGRHTPA